MASLDSEFMMIPMWAWCVFAISFGLVILFLLLDWLLIRRNALSSTGFCLSFRRHPTGKYGYSGASQSGAGGQDGGGSQGMGAGLGGQGQFGHHKRSTNLILAV